jgi:hypothetical protein
VRFQQILCTACVTERQKSAKEEILQTVTMAPLQLIKNVREYAFSSLHSFYDISQALQHNPLNLREKKLGLEPFDQIPGSIVSGAFTRRQKMMVLSCLSALSRPDPML